jgi:hypothetical protein
MIETSVKISTQAVDMFHIDEVRYSEKRSEVHWHSSSALGSQSRGIRFDSWTGRYIAMRNILGQDVHSHVLRPTQPFIPPGSINRVLVSVMVKAEIDHFRQVAGNTV